MKRLFGWLFKLTAFRIGITIGMAFAFLHFYSVSAGWNLPVVGRLELILNDLKFAIRGEIRPAGDVVVAAVDEKSIKAYGRFPWDRRIIARLVDKLGEMGAKVVAFDMSFSDKDLGGQFAGAKRFSERFKDVSPGGPRGKEIAGLVQQAVAGVEGAGSVAEELKGTPQVKLLRSRLDEGRKPLAEADKLYRQLARAANDYGEELEREVKTLSPDAALAEAIARRKNVILGMILMTEADQAHLTATEREDHLARVVDSSMPSLTYEAPAREGEIGVSKVLDGTGSLFPYAGLQAPLPEIIAAADNAAGFFNVQPDPDGVIRRAILVAGAGPRVFPSLELAAVARYHGYLPFDIVPFVADESQGRLDRLRLAEANLTIPVNMRGQLILNYYGGDGTFQNFSIADILDGATPKSAVAGKVVIVAATAIGTYDQRVTPFEPITAGVEIHATAIQNILSGDALRRPWWADIFELTLLPLLALIFGLLFARVQISFGVPALALSILAYWIFDYLLFKNGQIVFAALPALQLITMYVGQTIFRYAAEEKDKRFIRSAFQKYLPPSVIDQIVQDPKRLKLGGDKLEMTVLFSDIRGFTTISERLSPEKLVHVLNDYLTPMTELVFTNKGTLDKYIGDAVMAFWGAPMRMEDHAFWACKTALEMMSTLAELRKKWQAEGMPDIDIGIGLNSGPMAVGNMGSKDHFSYTVMGDNVNLGSRLEGVNKEYGTNIIISQFTYAHVKDTVIVRELDLLRVKGKHEPVRIFELVGLGGAEAPRAEWHTLYDQALDEYRKQNFDHAIELFTKVIDLKAGDGPAETYLDRCEKMKEQPPGPMWDGVYVMKTK